MEGMEGIVIKKESRQTSEEGMYDAMLEREEEADHTVQIPTNYGLVGYVEYVNHLPRGYPTGPLRRR